MLVFLTVVFSVILIISGFDHAIGQDDGTSMPPPDDFTYEPQPFITAGGKRCDYPNMTASSSLAVLTDKQSYAPSQVVYITPFVTDKSGCPAEELVDIQINKGSKVLQRYTVPPFPSFPLTFIVDESGTYTVNGSTVSTNPSSTTFNVKDWYQTRYFFFLLVGVLSAIGLMVVISIPIKNYALQEVLRFVLTSGIVISVILSFVFIEEEIGILAPVGLVKDVVDDFDQPSNTVNSPITPDDSQPLGLFPTGNEQLQWVVNIGGMRDVVQSIYIGGIQIPVYVVLFGFAGGYLRYLYEIARLNLKDRQLERVEKEHHDQLSKRIEKLRKNKNEPHEQITEAEINVLERTNENALRNDMHRLLFYRSIKDLATLFLSPLLAIVMFFILVQWEPTQTSVFILAVVSFGTGLVTDEIVRLLIRTVQSIIGSVHAPDGKTDEDLETEDLKVDKKEQKKK